MDRQSGAKTFPRLGQYLEESGPDHRWRVAGNEIVAGGRTSLIIASSWIANIIKVFPSTN